MAVGVTRERMASATDTAVEAADERPHFLIKAPPRRATCVCKTMMESIELTRLVVVGAG